MRAVGADEAALEPVEIRLVDEMEEVERRDGRVALDEADEVAVDACLRGLADRLRALAPGVGALRAGRNACLPPGLVEDEGERGPLGRREEPGAGLLEGRLRRPVERVPHRLLDPGEVRHAGVRPLVALEERIVRGARIRIGMEGELVHDRLRPAARPVGETEVVNEADRRGGDVARGLRAVVAAGREAEPDHVDGRVDSLERVVREREHLLVGGSRDTATARGELRAPEARLVRLVADDELLHLRVRAREQRDVVGELACPAGCRGDVRGMERLDAEDDLDVGRGRDRE